MDLRTGIVIFMLALTGCAGMSQEELRQQTLNYVEANDRPDYVRDALLNLRPAKGMSPKDIEYLYGKPKRVNQASYGTQAVYTQVCASSRKLFQDNIYIYYEGNEVTSWQIGGCIY